MRVTDSTVIRGYLSNLSSNLEQLSKLQDQQSSGQKLRRPSDDPLNVAREIDINDSIARNNQYSENIEDGTEWIKTTDDALSKISDYIGRIDTLTNAAANGTNSDTQLYAYKAEIQEDINGIVDIANTNYNGSYIFSGYKTQTKTLSLNPDSTAKDIFINSGNDGSIVREISPGVTVGINSTANQIFNLDNNNPPTETLGIILKDVLDGLSDTSKRGNLTTALDRLTVAKDNILKLRAEVGAKQNRLESAGSNNETENYNLTESLSKVADIDIAEQTVKVNVASAVYQSSLIVGAKIIQPSLLDFLK